MPFFLHPESQIFAPSYDRISKDVKINYGGICLTQMESRLALLILNGNSFFIIIKAQNLLMCLAMEVVLWIMC